MVENHKREKLILTKEQWEQMRSEVDRRAPEEACGLLAGLGDQVREVIPVPNALRSPVRYKMSPPDQWQAFQHIDEKGLEMVGIYHSHPSGPEEPSPTDIDEAYYPEAVYLIWSRRAGVWRCRGFRIQEGRVGEVFILLAGRE